jgi:integrase
MGRVAKGSIIYEGGRYKARITLADGRRRTVHLPVGLTEEQAREEAERLSQMSRDTQTEPIQPPELETVASYGKRFVDWKIAREHSSATDTRGRLKNWVYPVIGHLPIAAVTKSDLEAVVRALDAAASDEEISPKTAGNVWGDVTSMFRQAESSKDPALQVRADNPTAKVIGPDEGIDKAKPILFADEALRLFECEAVPVERRRVYAVAVYLAARANEIAALTARDFDLAHDQVTITRQRDRKTGEDKATKTERARATDLEPALRLLVEALIHERPTGRLFPDMPDDETRAAQLRADLRSAGVIRRELHEHTAQHLPLWFHHLRDTGLTWMAVRGGDPLRIQWRGGHTDFKTTQRYIAQGRMLAAGAAFRSVPPFPALPVSIIPARFLAHLAEKDRENVASPTGFENVSGPQTDLDPQVSDGSDGRDPGDDGAIGADSGVPARPLRRGEMHPREAARIARDATIAASVRRALRHALDGDERNTHRAMQGAIAVKWGRG